MPVLKYPISNHTNRSISLMRILGLFLLALSLIQCTEPEPPIDVVPEFIDPLVSLPDEGPVSFANPVVGQRSYYVLFEAVKTNSNIDFQYKPDTLVFAITNKESDAWVVTEFLTEGSNSRVNPDDSYFGNWGDTLFVSYVKFESDSIHFYKDPDKIFVSFAFHREQKFPLQLVSDKFEQNPDGLPQFGATSGRWMEYTKDYTVFGKTFERLNIYFNYLEMNLDGYGYTYIYGPADGIVRSAWVNYWTTDEAAGWDLIPR